MLLFRVWQIKTSKIKRPETSKIAIIEIPFRYLEKNVLYLIKHIIQELLFISAKYWFTLTTKTKKCVSDKWPKINAYFEKKPELNTPYRHSFFRKAILESKAKIKSIKEKVKEDINN